MIEFSRCPYIRSVKRQLESDLRICSLPAADQTVTVDLRNLPEDTYYLATTHEGDRASYYYLLTVR
jgi:hypothetical protein